MLKSLIIFLNISLDLHNLRVNWDNKKKYIKKSFSMKFPVVKKQINRFKKINIGKIFIPLINKWFNY